MGYTKDLRFICAQPDDNYFIWQVNVWLESLRAIGKSNKAISLIFTPKGREQNKNWEYVKSLYPESEFFFLKDEDDITKLISVYIPILRPYILMKYFKLHPEMKDKAVLYCDADVVFTENFNVDKYLDDDICYLSDTNSYINASYFDHKVKDVLPDKKEEYLKKDVLEDLAKQVGISRKIAEENNLNFIS